MFDLDFCWVSCWRLCLTRGQLFFQAVQAPAYRPVIHGTANTHDRATHQRGVFMESGEDRALREAGNLRFKGGAGRVIELVRRRDLDFGDSEPAVHLVAEFLDDLVEE